MKYLIGILIAVLVFVSLVFWLLRPPADFSVGTVYSVKSGLGLLPISKDLEAKGFVRSAAAFQFFVILFAGDKGVIAGDYLFNRPLSTYSLAQRMVLGRYSISAVKVTIPEGFDNLEIAGLLEEKLTDFEKDKFIELAKNEQGYLFPDTYFFFPTTSPENAIKIMRDNFNKKTAELLSEIEGSGKSLADIVIMASVIERESSGQGDRLEISGILWKRLSVKMPLQADAAPETYERPGLPARPICNPGLESIRAALNPAKISYLYYLHDKSGNIHYAKTYEEHKRNIARYLK